MITNVETTLNDLYDQFGYAEDGDDYAHVGLTLNQQHIVEEALRYTKAINAARAAAGALDWNGVLAEAEAEVDAAADPQERTDALLRLAATALTCAASLQRQTDKFNAVTATKAKAKETGE